MSNYQEPRHAALQDRRKSSTHIDGIHNLPVGSGLAPAQFYSTESGRLFHSGRIVIATVGLPARGKTHLSVALARYLRWLGVKTKIFHLGDYRRRYLGPGNDVPADYFHVNASSSTKALRQRIVGICLQDIANFLDHENGQIAIYDAVNALASTRRQLADDFARHHAQTLFIESLCDDLSIIEDNVRNVKISSPDYAGWPEEKAVKHYLDRMSAKIPHFETIEEHDLNFIKMINAGERIVVNNCNFGYLSHRIVYYLLNIHIKARNTFFVSAGSSQGESYKADLGLTSGGLDRSTMIHQCLMVHREKARVSMLAHGPPVSTEKPLTVWTSTRRRTREMAQIFADQGCQVKQRSQMSRLNPGICENMPGELIRLEYPEEMEQHDRDPYHHRFPRAEVRKHNLQRSFLSWTND